MGKGALTPIPAGKEYDGGRVQVLAKDHEEVKGLLAELEKGPTRATGASQDQLALRKKMPKELIIEESKHEALEEMYSPPSTLLLLPPPPLLPPPLLAGRA